MADTKFSDIHTQATGNTEHHGYDGNTTFDFNTFVKPDWTWIDPYTVIPNYPYYPQYPYPVTITYPEERKTGLTIEGTPEEVADLIRHFACRIKVTIVSMGEEDN